MKLEVYNNISTNYEWYITEPAADICVQQYGLWYSHTNAMVTKIDTLFVTSEENRSKHNCEQMCMGNH